jgi:hypothetical protein
MLVDFRNSILRTWNLSKVRFHNDYIGTEQFGVAIDLDWYSCEDQLDFPSGNTISWLLLAFFLPHPPDMFRNITSIPPQHLPFKSVQIYNLAIIHAVYRLCCSYIPIYAYNRNYKFYISLYTTTCFGNQIAIFTKYIGEYEFMYDL